MLDFEIENHRLYTFTAGALGRHYDNFLYKAGALSLEETSRQEIKEAFNLLLDRIEELQAKQEESTQYIQFVRNCIHNLLENEQGMLKR